MNMWWIIGTIAWAVISVINFKLFIADYKASLKRIKNGDIVFCAFLAAAGPLAFPAALSAVPAVSTRIKAWTERQVWP